MLSPSRFERFTDSEWRWCRAVNQRAQGTRWLPFFGWLSRAGDGWVWYALLLALIACGGELGRLAALHCAAIGLASLVLYKFIKALSKRPRPLARHEGMQLSVAPLDEFSFPSGHTLHAVAFTLVACQYFPWLALILVPLSVGIALSRVVLGLHYPSDVLAAVALGLGLGLL